MFRIKYNDSPNLESIKTMLSTWLEADEVTFQYFLRGLHTKNRICNIEAFENEEMVGLLTAWKSEIHPYCTYFSIVSKPHFGFDIETLLFDVLSKQQEIQRPLQTSIWESSYRLKAFYEKNNFLEIRRTYSPLLATSKLEILSLFAGTNIHYISKVIGSDNCAN